MTDRTAPFIRDMLEQINHNSASSAQLVSALNSHLFLNKLPILNMAEEILVQNSKGDVVASSHPYEIGKNFQIPKIFPLTTGEKMFK